MCTWVFWSDNGVAKVASRTMDWVVSDDPVLWAVPEGTRRAAGDVAWESRFGVVGLSMWDSGTTDAVNSAGLAAHLLYLGSAGFAAPGSPGAISNLLWAQWVLDNCATVDEAVTALHDLPVVSIPVRGQEMGCHLALEDAPAALNFGDCFTYALAERTGYPVLCTGDDFATTDIAVVRPQRAPAEG